MSDITLVFQYGSNIKYKVARSAQSKVGPCTDIILNDART